jgi:hypothetical protein
MWWGRTRGRGFRGQGLVVIGACAAIAGFATPAAAATPGGGTVGTTYYLDCAGHGPGNGTLSDPWTSLASVDSTSFAPGSTLLIARGTTCEGTLSPQGSGTAAAPITISAYGSGSAPVIDGGSNEEAVLLDNQQYWTITDREITTSAV